MVRSIALPALFVAALTTAASAQSYSGSGVAVGPDWNDEASVTQFVDNLRSQGPVGLEAALARLDDLNGRVATVQSQASDYADDETYEKALADVTSMRDAMQQAVDRVAAERGATVSRLYWYTDLDAAKRAADESGRPILSLRMLGKLTDEYSCANSRFFRTALYSNAEISDYLRDHFILHWQSVRPVPRVTIDFGDGRKLERTITGNSAHYVLDAAGRPLDVLPGLYGPNAFLAWLTKTEKLAKDVFAGQFGCFDGGGRPGVLARYHTAERDAVDANLQTDLGQANLPTDSTASLDDEAWRKIAALHRADAVLDQSSIGVMRRENPNLVLAQRRTMSKARIEEPIVEFVRSFQNSIALDTVKNEYTLHQRIHEWFVDSAPDNIDALNQRVYSELFLTPSSDPWLGLAPADAYTGLEGGGLTMCTAPSNASPLGASHE